MISFLLFVMLTYVRQDVAEGQSSAPLMAISHGPELYNGLFDNNLFHEVKIVMTKDSFDGLSEDMLAYKLKDERMRVGSYQKADVYFLLGDEWFLVDQVGIRTRGNTSRTLPEERGQLNKFHFKLKFDETFDYDKEDQEAALLENRTFAGLTALNFKWDRFTDSTYVRELTAYEMLKEAGVTAPNASMVHVIFEINNEVIDYGMYTMVEPIDKAFIEKRFGKANDGGDLYKCLWQDYGPATLEPITDMKAVGVKAWLTGYRPAYDLKTNESHSPHEALLRFINDLITLEGKDFETFLQNRFDTDSFLRYQALAVLIGMPDDYWAMGNNYYLYFDETGMCHFIPFDYDSGFGGGWGAEPWGYEGIATADILKWYNLNREFTGQDHFHPLIDKLLKLPEYQRLYLSYMDQYVNGDTPIFTYENYKKNLQQFNEMYGDYVDNDIYGDMPFGAGNEACYFEEKQNSVRSQLEVIFNTP